MRVEKNEIISEKDVFMPCTHTMTQTVRGSLTLLLLCCARQVGEPNVVLLLNCSVDTMSSRLRCRGRSSSSFHPDRDDAVHRRAECFCTSNQAVAAHYERKTLLNMVKKRTAASVQLDAYVLFIQIAQAHL